MALKIREREGAEMGVPAKTAKIYPVIRAALVEHQRVKKMSKRSPSSPQPMMNIVRDSGEGQRSSRLRLLTKLSFLLHPSPSLNTLMRLVTTSRWQTSMRRLIC